MGPGARGRGAKSAGPFAHRTLSEEQVTIDAEQQQICEQSQQFAPPQPHQPQLRGPQARKRPNSHGERQNVQEALPDEGQPITDPARKGAPAQQQEDEAAAVIGTRPENAEARDSDASDTTSYFK